MEIQNRQKYLPFGYKLMLSYFVLIIIPVLLIGYSANSIFVNSIREQTRSNIQGTLQQMKDNISYKMEDTSRLSDLLYFDDTLADHLRHYEEGWVSYSATTQYLLPKFHTTIEATNRKMWLSIYLHNDTLPEIYNDYKGTDPLAMKRGLFDLYHIKRITEKDWYLEYPVEQYGITMDWKQIDDDDKFGRISLLRRIVDINTPLQIKEIGFIRISVHIADLFESVDYQKIGDGTTIFILNESRRILIASGTTESMLGRIWDENQTEDNLIIEEHIPDLDWNLIALVPADISERDSKKVRNITFIICSVSLIVFFLVGFFISRYFSERVSKIISVLDAFQEGAFHKRIHFKGNDEFSRISLAFNEMGQNTGDLIQKVYLTNIQKKEAELESLQAQINPHFLYNTLSSISRLAKFGETEKLQRMVMDLAKFYRLSLNEGRTVIPVSDELEQAKAYIDIQKTKYEQRMNVQYDIDPEILRYETIKLILQPFIENVLEHAWCGDLINIQIVGLLDGGNIEFKIIDDGIGIHPDLTRQIFDSIRSLSVGYGIRNVDQRIKLYYGEAYGVTIFSGQGFGTTIRIIIPAKHTREVENSHNRI